jgi:hypothetical protein
MEKNVIGPDECVEALCQDGCDMVNRYISLMRDDQLVPALQHLTDEERMRVLRELESIMAVYGQRCGN